MPAYIGVAVVVIEILIVHSSDQNGCQIMNTTCFCCLYTAAYLVQRIIYELIVGVD